MFPDVDGFEYWSNKAKELECIGCRVIVSDLLERNATDEERDNKIDLADWIIVQLSTGREEMLFAGEPAPFVLELPPYRLPSLHNMLTHVWQKVKGFLIKAGTLILLMSILLWLLQSFDFSLHMVENEADSMLGALGSVIAPIFKPLGFGFWQAAVALLTGLIAKEMVVSSLSMFYAFPLTATGAQVAAAMTGFTPLSAFSMLVFILLYVPCVAAVSTLAKEMNSTKWTLFSIGWQLGVAYVASLLVYQVGSLFL